MNIWLGDEDIKAFITQLAIKFPCAGYDIEKVTNIAQVQFLSCSFYDAIEVYQACPEVYSSQNEATECCFDNAWRLILKGDY